MLEFRVVENWLGQGEGSAGSSLPLLTHLCSRLPLVGLVRLAQERGHTMLFLHILGDTPSVLQSLMSGSYRMEVVTDLQAAPLGKYSLN